LNEVDRRPLASRQTGWAQAAASWLAETRITPNQISMLSMVAAFIACVLFWWSAQLSAWPRAIALLLAALACQLRLLCNLFDGMVAVEAGKKTADGPAWNEFPDRVADVLILVGVGLAVASPALGWAAAAFALSTAYVRELGKGIDYHVDYSGPMAKPQRMAVITVAAVINAIDWLWSGQGQVLEWALWLVAIGSLFTAGRRTVALLQRLA